MNAKNTPETLFVRVPPELKRRIETSASVRRVSMSTEVARLLTERLKYSLLADLEAQARGLEASIYKGQLERLEALILDCAVKSVGPAGTKQLHILADMILEMRRNREQAKEKNERSRMEQETRLSEKKPQVPLLLAPLFSQDDTSSSRLRLGKEELRRHKEEVRRLNPEKELNSKGKGARTKLAAALQCKPGYVSQMLSPRQKKGHRAIGEKVAPKIEAALGLKSGALDKDDYGFGVVAIERAADELEQVLKELEAQR